MAKTSTELVLKLFDDTIKNDSIYVAPDKQPFIDITQLNAEATRLDYATLEKDQWALNASKDLYPVDMTGLSLGYWSLSQSDALGDIDVTLNVNFTTTHSVYGLTLIFYPNDHATQINVKWYDGATVVADRDVLNDKELLYIDQSVVTFDKIEIRFTKLNKPYHYLKLSSVGFGSTIIFNDADIQSCKIVEEVNTTSEEISINTMSASMLIKDTDYLLNIYQVMADQQTIEAYEYVNGVKKDMGTFYLTTRSNPSESQLKINAIDLIGVMDKSTYLGGMINDTFGNVIDSIMASFGTTLYTIDSSLINLTISGYIPVTTYRDAIKRVCFAVNAVVDCSRTETIDIYPLPTTSPVILSKNDYFIGSKQDELEKITTVELGIKSYEQSTETQEVYKATLSAGTYLTTFTEPYYNYNITGATIDQSDVNYVQFTTSGGVVTINANRYTESTQTFIKTTPNLPLNVKDRKAEYQNTILWDGLQNVSYLYDKNYNQTERTIKKVVGDEKVGDYAQADALYDKILTGYITSLEIDMTRGFVGQYKIGGTIS